MPFHELIFARKHTRCVFPVRLRFNYYREIDSENCIKELRTPIALPVYQTKLETIKNDMNVFHYRIVSRGSVSGHEHKSRVARYTWKVLTLKRVILAFARILIKRSIVEICAESLSKTDLPLISWNASANCVTRLAGPILFHCILTEDSKSGRRDGSAHSAFDIPMPATFARDTSFYSTITV